MNCTFCSAPLPINSLVCSHCQQRNPLDSVALSPLNKNEPTAQQHKCPECKTNSLEYLEIGGLEESITILECNFCHGNFLDKELLEKVIFLYGWKRKKVHKEIKNYPITTNTNDPLYPCPICEATMKRFSFKISSDVLIDECLKHGVWLNKGELYRLIEWKKDLKSLRNNEEAEENYRKYGLKKQKSKYTYQKKYATPVERFLEWLMGV